MSQANSKNYKSFANLWTSTIIYIISYSKAMLALSQYINQHKVDSPTKYFR